jgi:hypothetical protein
MRASAELARLRGENEKLKTAQINCGCHHPDVLVGMHWLAGAYDRICAGDDETETMCDFGWVSDKKIDALRQSEARLREALQNIEANFSRVESNENDVAIRSLREIRKVARAVLRGE